MNVVHEIITFFFSSSNIHCAFENSIILLRDTGSISTSSQWCVILIRHQTLTFKIRWLIYQCVNEILIKNNVKLLSVPWQELICLVVISIHVLYGSFDVIESCAYCLTISRSRFTTLWFRGLLSSPIVMVNWRRSS
jgi:hypothetical protein